MAIRFSKSSVEDFRRCKRLYMYKYVEGLEPRRIRDNLKRGSWMHSLFQAHYQGLGWEKAQARLVKQFNNLLLEEREYYGDMPADTERMMKAYVWEYRNDEKEWEYIHVEESFDIPVGDEGDVYTFKPDLIAYSIPTKEYWVWDHKTTKGIPPPDFRLRDLQSTNYPYFVEKALGIKVEGFLFNYVRTKPPSIPSINLDGNISRKRIDTDFYTMATFLKEYYQVDAIKELPSHWKHHLKSLQIEKKFFRRIKLVKDEQLVNRTLEEMDYTAQEMDVWHEMAEKEDDDRWVRTLEKSCDWCGFNELCMMELLGHDSTFIRKRKYRQSEYAKGKGKKRG